MTVDEIKEYILGLDEKNAERVALELYSAVWNIGDEECDWFLDEVEWLEEDETIDDYIVKVVKYLANNRDVFLQKLLLWIDFIEDDINHTNIDEEGNLVRWDEYLDNKDTSTYLFDIEDDGKDHYGAYVAEDVGCLANFLAYGFLNTSTFFRLMDIKECVDKDELKWNQSTAYIQKEFSRLFNMLQSSKEQKQMGRLIDATALKNILDERYKRNDSFLVMSFVKLLEKSPTILDFSQTVILLEKSAEEIENCYGKETDLSREIRGFLGNIKSFLNEKNIKYPEI